MPFRKISLHGALFLLTFASVTFTCMIYAAPNLDDFWGSVLQGLPFSALLMLFLTAHEFGHYIAARRHGVAATLPFYLPMPFMLFGTLGAVIRIKSQIPSRKALFDIGVAGPLAGFVVALAYLIIGMATIPGSESLYAFHPEYRGLAVLPEGGMHFGGFLLYDLLQSLLISPGQFFPPTNEMYHYPFLCMGWFGMFVTAINLLPIGQLDGGHILYALVGRHQKTISKWALRILILIGLGGIGQMLLEATRFASDDPFYETLRTIFGPPMEWVAANASWWFSGWMGWLLWAGILRFLIPVAHPSLPDERPLDRRRMVIGWLSILIFLLTFSVVGIYELPLQPAQQQQSSPAVVVMNGVVPPPRLSPFPGP